MIYFHHFLKGRKERKKQDHLLFWWLQPYLALIVDSRVSVLIAMTYMENIHYGHQLKGEEKDGLKLYITCPYILYINE